MKECYSCGAEFKPKGIYPENAHCTKCLEESKRRRNRPQRPLKRVMGHIFYPDGYWR